MDFYEFIENFNVQKNIVSSTFSSIVVFDLIQFPKQSEFRILVQTGSNRRKYKYI